MLWALERTVVNGAAAGGLENWLELLVAGRGLAFSSVVFGSGAELIIGGLVAIGGNANSPPKADSQGHPDSASA